MPVTSLPWIHDPDAAGNYIRGLQLGSQVAEANARLQQEQVEVGMRSQARQDALKQQALQENARIETARSYHEQQIGIQQQRLQEVAQMNALKTRDAAMKVAGQQKLAALVNAGVPLEKALFQVPELATTSGAVAAARLGLSNERVALTEERLKNTEASQKAAQEHADRVQAFREEQANKDKTTIGISIRNPAGDVVGTARGAPEDLERRYTTNVPPQLRSKAAGAAPPFGEGATIRSKKDGKLYVIKNGVPVPAE